MELRLAGAPPWIVTLERLIETEDIGEIEPGISGLTDEQPEVDEGEDDISDVGGRAHSPMVEHQASHYAIAIECQVAARFRELAASDVASFRQTRLRELERRKDEEIRMLMEPRLAEPNLVHDSITKRQLRQCWSSSLR